MEAVGGNPTDVCNLSREKGAAMSICFERFFEMPRVYTFEMPKLRRWVESRLRGRTLNLFGGKVRLTHIAPVVHNDIRAECQPDTMLDAFDPDAIITLGVFETIVFDPPYSSYQAVHSYGGVKMQEVTRARESVHLALVPGGRVISLGWNSTGMSASRGYVKDEILLVNSGGSHNDIIVLVEHEARSFSRGEPCFGDFSGGPCGVK